MDLTTNYMGLTLRSPLVASASPLNAEAYERSNYIKILQGYG
jgi:hypothetical protein